ncbi:MAG: lipoyl(octanoyl) transferase [Cyanobacteria bacterium J083]|nr:MAG: lipoyl(octanoyl) transferase [Cyanobacteria bacterium J083]
MSYFRKCLLIEQQIVSYERVWQQQKELVQARINNPSLDDALILVEHYPVYTLGKAAQLDFVKFPLNSQDFTIYRTERGGEVTYHSPGQLVVYPILNLNYYKTDLHWYLRQLEEVIIQLISKYGLIGYRIPGLTGVWLEGYKVAAIGIKVRRWITMHGFSLNVCPDLTGFKHIVPCGISQKPVGSLVQFLPDLKIAQVRKDILEVIAQVLSIKFLATSQFEQNS